MALFKVGDRVRYTGAAGPAPWFRVTEYVGRTGEVLEVDPHRGADDIRFNVQFDDGSRLPSAREGNLEPVLPLNDFERSVQVYINQELGRA